MNFKLTRFEAPTMGEVLEKIQAALGSDAMIVSTRTLKKGGLLGIGGHQIVEVYAADTRSRIENIKREASSRSRGGEPTSQARPDTSPAPFTGGGFRVGVRESGGMARGAAAEAPAKMPGEPGPRSRTGEDPRPAHPFLRECHDILTSREVDARIADLIVREIAELKLPPGYPDPARVRSVVRAQLVNLFVAAPPVDETRRPRIVVLVGPTGVGKTTTIAKLAARAKIHERKKVGLATMDTFRIAAVDQLEKYAQIIGLPLLVATSPRELEAAVDELVARDVDVVFIDSAGRSYRDELKMAELREFLSVLPDAEVHLVVSTTTHGKTIQSVASRFAGIGFHKVILTKVDETISFGSLVGALVSIGRPVSFVTDGQNVPDDIVPGDPERLAELVLKVHAL
jgi:flagellar biosynthesis protein FlhF